MGRSPVNCKPPDFSVLMWQNSESGGGAVRIVESPVSEGEKIAAPRVKAGWRGVFSDISHGLVVALLHPVVNLLGLAGLLVGFLVLPPQGTGPSTCGMQRVTGLPCPSCGLTRSVTCALQGEMAAAWEYNPFGFLFAGAFLLLGGLLFVPPKAKRWLRERSRIWGGVATVVFLVGLGGLLVHGFVRGLLIQGDAPGYRWWRGTGIAPALEGREGFEGPGRLRWTLFPGEDSGEEAVSAPPPHGEPAE